MTDFNDLILKHKGKRICIMGGAPSLENDLMAIDADIYISTNAHGVDLITPDYVFAMDEINTREHCDMGQYLKSKTSAPIISKRPYADYQLVDYPQCPRDVLSGMVAAWVAFIMGAKVVILAGMDAYNGDEGYIHEAVKMARDIHCHVRVMSDSLAKVWDKYDPKEKFTKYTPHSSIAGWIGKDGKITIEVLQPTSIRNKEMKAGERLQVMRHEVLRLLKHKMIKEV